MLDTTLKDAMQAAGLPAPRGKITTNEADGYAETTAGGETYRATADGTLYLVLERPAYRPGEGPGRERPAFLATYAIAGPGAAGPAGRRAQSTPTPSLAERIRAARAYHAQRD